MSARERAGFPQDARGMHVGLRQVPVTLTGPAMDAGQPAEPEQMVKDSTIEIRIDPDVTRVAEVARVVARHLTAMADGLDAFRATGTGTTGGGERP